ncbi:MAG: hypothetical protein GY862_36510 [Gammaproteobacteria bacterium]|nr:hypothetical protein [Gammaproteobacteria bacterium]
MKFLTDVGVGRQVETWLQQQGYDCKAVRDLNSSMADRDIIRLAFEEQRIVVTMDKDFGELVYHSGMEHRGVLLLRLDDATGPEKVQVMTQIIEHYGDQLTDCFCVFQGERLRIRKVEH